MQICETTVICKTEPLILTNLRAAYWPAQKMLILSDVHIGKTAHFRKSGIPISLEVLDKDLQRLGYLIDRFKPETLMVVGDLFHAEFNADVTRFKTWIKHYTSLQILLVKGNHDRSLLRLYEHLNIKIIKEELELSPFVFTHDKTQIEAQDTNFYISGHTHPGVFLKGMAKQRIKLPCYQINKHQLILPAFSLFTGLNTNNPPKSCINYAFTDTEIFKL